MGPYRRELGWPLFGFGCWVDKVAMVRRLLVKYEQFEIMNRSSFGRVEDETVGEKGAVVREIRVSLSFMVRSEECSA